MVKNKNMFDFFQKLVSKKCVWIAFIFLGILAKVILLPFASADYINFLEPWVNFIKENGYFSALQYDFYDYTPSYMYMLVLLAKIGWNPLYSIKVVSILFEYLAAYFIGRMAFMKYQNKNMFDFFQKLVSKKGVWIAFIFLGVLAKVILFPFASADYINFLEPWVNFIKENGYFSALQYDFYDYTPSYMYMLVILAKIGLNPLYSIKVVSILFEYLAAYFIGRMAFMKYQKKNLILVSLAIVPLIPTVLLNSSYLAQCDSIYTAFAIGSIYFTLKNKTCFAVLFLGISFAFKMQTVMVLPFFFVMMLRGNIKWYYYLMVPAVYCISLVPAWAMGRPFSELLTVYFSQADRYQLLTMNFPNVYIWINNDYYAIASTAGIIFTCLLTLISGIILGNKKYNFTFENWVRLAFLGAIIVPFFLPGMHERYMYLGDILAVLYFLLMRKNIHLPIGIILISTYSYIRCSRFHDILPESPAFFLYVLIIILLIIDFVKSLNEEKMPCSQTVER